MPEADTGVDVVRVRVPGKINLSLGVGPREDDGYHRLATVFQAVSIFDDVTVRWAPAGQVRVRTSGRQSDHVADDPTNLAHRAAVALRDRFGGDWGADIAIHKDIPVAGGMAGGSADAAAALLACSVLWDLAADHDDLRELGAELGADVPFCLMGGTAVGTGRGDELVPALSRGHCHWVLAITTHRLSTPEVFAEYDRLRPDPAYPQVPAELMSALGSGRPDRIAAALGNDLTEAACSLHPELAELLALGERAGALAGLVSGSGPTVAFLVADEADAVDVHLRLKAELDGEVELRRVHGPVPGARPIHA